MNKNPGRTPEQQKMDKMMPDATAREELETIEGTSSCRKCKIKVRDPPPIVLHSNKPGQKKN